MPSLAEIIAWVTTPEVSKIILVFIIGYLLLLWVSLIIWTTKDIISRSNNVVSQIISILLVVILNIFGIFIYLGIRPSKTLIEKFFEDLEYEALSQSMQTDSKEIKEKKKKKIEIKAEKPEKKKGKKKR